MHLLLLRNQLKPIRIEKWREKCRKKAIGTSLKDLCDLPEDDLYNWYNLYIYIIYITFMNLQVTEFFSACHNTTWKMSSSLAEGYLVVLKWVCRHMSVPRRLMAWFWKTMSCGLCVEKNIFQGYSGERCQRRCDTIHNVEQRNKETHIFMMVQNEVNPTVNQPSDQASKTVIFSSQC